VADVKFLRQENERLKAKVKEGQEALSDYKVKLHSGDMKSQEIRF